METHYTPNNVKESKQVDYYIRNNYGTPTRYFANPELEQIIWNMTGVKTITPAIQRGLERLGYTFTLIIEPALVILNK